MKKTKVNDVFNNRLAQGDIIKDVEFIEFAIETEGNIEISKILFPLVVVLTQDCDLEQDFKNRTQESNQQDKYLFSVIVAPLYNVEHVYSGEHLNGIDLQMQLINRRETKTENKFLKQNKNPRYHYLEFEESIPIVNSVIDFKHYFTVNVNYLQILKKTNFICKISGLYREDISQRFSSFLSRIGLP